MSSKSVVEIIKLIATDNSKIFKETTLNSENDNTDLRDILKYCYDPMYNYYISAVELPFHMSGQNDNIPFALFEALSNKTISGNQAKIEVLNTINSSTPEVAQLIKWVIEKDVHAGFGITTINKVWKNLISETPYMGAIGFNEKKAKAMFPNKDSYAFADTKMDGRYVNVIIFPDHSIEMVSRQGKRSFIDNQKMLKDAVSIYKNFGINSGIVLNGELIIPGMARYESNGLISSIVTIAEKISENKDVSKELKKFVKENGKTYEEACALVNVSIWDYIPFEFYKTLTPFNMPRFERIDKLILNTSGCSAIKVCDFKIVKSYEEAISVFSERLAEGEEGIILKSASGIWKDGKGNQQIKMKLEFDCDLIIYGFNEGEKGSKNEGKLGSFKCSSTDAIVRCDPSGISDSMREDVWDNQSEWLSQIITVKCNGLSKDSKGNYSLLHPRFKELRTDKGVADSFEQIKGIQNSILGLSSSI